MKNFIMIFTSILVLSSCATRVKVLSVPAVSMTKYNTKKKYKMINKGEVEERFCPDPYKMGTIGLIDELVKNVQKSSGADLITNAVFYQEGSCMILTGNAIKLKRRR